MDVENVIYIFAYNFANVGMKPVCKGWNIFVHLYNKKVLKYGEQDVIFVNLVWVIVEVPLGFSVLVDKFSNQQLLESTVRGICQVKVEYIRSGSQQKLRPKNWQILKFRSVNQLLKALTNLIILLYDLHFVLYFEVYQLTPTEFVYFMKIQVEKL